MITDNALILQERFCINRQKSGSELSPGFSHGSSSLGLTASPRLTTPVRSCFSLPLLLFPSRIKACPVNWLS